MITPFDPDSKKATVERLHDGLLESESTPIVVVLAALGGGCHTFDIRSRIARVDPNPIR